MSVQTFDLETTIKQSYKRKANPFDDENWVVAAGYKEHGKDSSTVYYLKPDEYRVSIPEHIQLLVGFNIKFDLLWSWSHDELRAFFKRGGRVWCCQYAEYLLEGQQPHAQMCSMDDIVLKYEGELKIDEVKALWKEGVNTPDIPEDLLIKYLHGDVQNTEKIFLGQLVAARRQVQLQDILARMDGLLATTEMEYNGLHVDQEQAEDDRLMLQGELAVIDEELLGALPELPDGYEFSWGSNVQKSCLIFGGTVKYKKWMPHLTDEGEPTYAKKTVKEYMRDGERTGITEEILANVREIDADRYEAARAVLDKFASGKRKGELKTKNFQVDDLTKPKGKITDLGFTFPGYTTPKPEWKGELTDFNGGPVYSVGGDIIEELRITGIPFLKALANREKIAKDLGTYYWVENDDGIKKGMLTCVMPDGRIHHKLNHSITVTTRLSSSDPNLQNTPRADFDKLLGRMKSVVKRMFSSRFGDEGEMTEIDYSQLEVVVQGLLTGDQQLIADLLAGVDFHCKRLAAKLKEDYDDVVRKCKVDEIEEYVEGRTKIKGFTFQRAYGAGPPAIAASTGMTIEEVKELIEVEEQLYPGITKFYDAVQASCNATRWPTMVRACLPDKPSVSVQCGRGEYKTPTQARFVFTEVPLSAYGRKMEKADTGFYRPHIQNWPIQGVGGQLVQFVLGKLFRHFVAKDNYDGNALMVNTVHDCVWFDSRKTHTKQMIADVVPIMESVPAILKELFDIDCPVPFPVDVECGPNMLELSHPH